MVKRKRLTRAERVKIGISKMIGGEEYTFLDHATDKKKALSLKKRYVSPKYPVRITKSKGEHKYEIWMRRR
jgi:hypothetical protein